MGHQNTISLLLPIIIIGVSLVGRGICDREEKSFQKSRDNDYITPSPLMGSTDGWRPVMPSAEDASGISSRSHHSSYRPAPTGNSNTHTNSHTSINSHVNSNSNEEQHKHVNINRHPVMSKLQAHMELAEKAKLKKQQDEELEASSVNEPFFSTTPNILGSFSSFGHSTVQHKEPAESKQEIMKSKSKKHSMQLSESINEYAYHLVPPPLQQIAPARFPDTSDMHRRKKPHMGYRYPTKDLHVEEQRHAYYVQPAPSRPLYHGPSTHTPKPPGYFYGGPQIPNFAGLPHHYPGALAGALFPGPDSIRYFQRPDIHNSGGNQFTHPPPIPLDSTKQGRPQDNGDHNREPSFRRPDPSPYKNTQHQEEFVTGRPSHEVRAPETNSFTVGSSFLAGNKHEEIKRPSQQYSTMLPPTFEQAFDTGRPSPVKEESNSYRIPTTLSNPHSEKGRVRKPFTPEEASVPNVQNIQITGPSHVRQQQFDQMFPPGVVEDAAPHFLPTVTSENTPFTLKDYPTPSPHINEIHQSSSPWSSNFQSSGGIVEVQGPSSVQEEQTTVRGPLSIEENPRPISTSNIVTYNPALQESEEQILVQNVQHNFESNTERRPSYEEERTTEDASVVQATERPTEQSERRPYQTRKPSRYRPRPATHQDDVAVSQQYEERPQRRPAYPKYPTSSVEEPIRTSEEESQPKEVRTKQRRRRPKPTVEIEDVTVLPVVEEDSEDAKYNHIDAETENHVITTTPRPRRKNPYGNRGQERHRIRTTTVEPTPIAEAFESQTAGQEIVEITQTPQNSEKGYAVHEEDQESAYESSTQSYVDEVTPEASTSTTSTTTSTTTTTTTSTTTPPPATEATTPVTTASRYKPRLRFGINSTRPRFSVKDYKDRITRLPQTSSTEKKETTTAPTETESVTPKRPNRIRGSYHKQEEKHEDEEAIQATTVESLRHKYRPKFGSGSARYRTTTSPPASEENDTERSDFKANHKRARLPATGKYYSRYRSTTETPLEEKIDLASASSEIVHSIVLPKLPTRPKSPFSPRLRFPPRMKYGAQNEVTTTEKVEDSATNQIETVKPVEEPVTPRTEYSTNFATTDSETAETHPTTPNFFDDFEETSKMIVNEIATKATKTFMFLPTVPTTFQYDYDNQKEADKTENTKDESSVSLASINDAAADIEVVEMKADDDGSASQRVADLTSAATSGGYFNTMLIAKRKPINKYTMATEDPILPIEAFFTNKEYHRE